MYKVCISGNMAKGVMQRDTVPVQGLEELTNGALPGQGEGRRRGPWQRGLLVGTRGPWAMVEAGAELTSYHEYPTVPWAFSRPC